MIEIMVIKLERFDSYQCRLKVLQLNMGFFCLITKVHMSKFSKMHLDFFGQVFLDLFSAYS